jgi:hypothetical protein
MLILYQSVCLPAYLPPIVSFYLSASVIPSYSFPKHNRVIRLIIAPGPDQPLPRLPRPHTHPYPPLLNSNRWWRPMPTQPTSKCQRSLRQPDPEPLGRHAPHGRGEPPGAQKRTPPAFVTKFCVFWPAASKRARPGSTAGFADP